MQWLIALAFVAVLLVYVFIVRPFLEQSVALSPVFKEEASLILQLRAKLAGWKTKIIPSSSPATRKADSAPGKSTSSSPASSKR